MAAAARSPRRRPRATIVLTAVLALLAPAALPAAAEPADYLDVSYSGSFSSGDAYTAAPGETMGGRLTRRTGGELLDPERGLVLRGGRGGAGFQPADLTLGDTTIDRAFVVETVFTPQGQQTNLATLVAVGGNFSVRYQNGKLRYGFDTQVDGSWTSRTRETNVPADGVAHVLSVAYLPEADGATVIAYLDGRSLPTVPPDGGRSVLATNRTELVGIGNDVHPSALDRGIVGSIGKTRFATVTGTFTPAMFTYQRIDYVQTPLQVSFSGTLDGETYQAGLGETVTGALTVHGGTLDQPDRLTLHGSGSGLAWDAGRLGEAPLAQAVLAEVVVSPDVLSGETTLIDVVGGIRLEAAGERTVRIVAGHSTATRELGEPAVRDGIPFHHLALLSDLDADGAGTVTLLDGGAPAGDPVPVTGVAAAAPTVAFLAGASGTAYGLAVTTGGDIDDLRLGRLPCTATAVEPANRIAITPGECATSIVSKASALRPSPRQVAWQEAEQTAFLHFGMNTFTGQEWGHGDEDPDLFQPSELATDQWARVLRDNGFRYAVLTVKHHDGFVLFPSRYTDHDVASSSWRDGAGDVLEEFTESAHRYGLKVGVYLSPSDWNQYHKGVFANGSPKTERTIPTLVPGDDRIGEAIPTFTYRASDYGAYFLNQLYEVLTQYGPVDEVWFDGADGGIPDANRESYDFGAYYDLIRTLAPQATIAVTGPDVRWVGNESGLARDNEWSTVAVAEDESGRRSVVPSAQAPEIGTDAALAQAGTQGATALAWWPAEVDVSIRPGWFHHDDQRPKSVDQLRHIYYSSVGRNSVLLLNVPPDRTGRLPQPDVDRLAEWTARLRQDMPRDLALGATVLADGKPAPQITDGDRRTAWVTPSASGSAVELELGATRTVDRLALSEDIAGGQQVRELAIDARSDNGSWRQVATTGTVGYQRIVPLDTPVTTDAVRVRVLSARGPAHLASISAYAATTDPVPVRSTYYVDCDADRAGIGTREAPLASLGQLRRLNLPAGSAVLLKRATTCEGPLELWGYGTDDAPATLGLYGRGAPPALPDPGTDQVLDQLRHRGWTVHPALNASVHRPGA